jgi:hypothetical protein
MKTLKLSTCEVDISEDKIKWGERELIKFTLFNPTTGSITAQSMLDSKIKRFEISIKEIRVDGKKVAFSKEWALSLPSDDGELLVDTFNDIDQKKNIELTQEKSSEEKEQVK